MKKGFAIFWFRSLAYGASRSLSASLLPAAAVCCAVVAVSCSKPKAPTIEPERISVNSITKQGISMVATLRVTNPNKFAISASRVNAKLTLPNNVVLRFAPVARKIHWAPSSTSSTDIELTATWQQAVHLAQLAALETIPFTVDGSFDIGGDTLHITVPFSMRGTLDRKQIIEATLKDVPEMLQQVIPKHLLGSEVRKDIEMQ